ncbi:MAG: ATP-binding cassette domain-containing protein [Chloroflexi bacterium]|nr:ATP-binding cassette domain-containing protein [Chloroflexota bacterium]
MEQLETAVVLTPAAEPVIRLENVRKRFYYKNERPSTLLEQLTALVKKQPGGHNDLWALNGVTLDVLPGQALGIIGRNGSGKSTLLKLIARILRPQRRAHYGTRPDERLAGIGRRVSSRPDRTREYIPECGRFRADKARN